jgi:hypothetical protein
MTDQKQALDELHRQIGLKRLNRTWAKLEIVFGLFAAGVGVLLGQWLTVRSPGPDWSLLGASLLLFVFGWYLALAGHRSHLYQSNNDLIAYLAQEIHRINSKADPNEHPR